MTIESLPAHNTKLSSITIRYMINNVIITAITIHNVIVAHLRGDDGVEIYQHGKTVASTLILLDQIRSITNHQSHGHHFLTVIVDLPVPCYQERE